MAKVNGRRVVQGAAAASAAAPYIRRLMSDTELRNELRELFGAASHLYGELSTDEKLHKLANDRKIRKDIDHIVESMQHAGQRVEKQTRKSHWGRNLFLVSAAGGTAALFIYPKTRDRIMRTMGVSRSTPNETIDFEQKAA